MNITIFIIFIILIGFIIWMLKYFEKNIPKRDARIIAEYDTKIKKAEIKKKYDKKENLKIQKVIDEEKKKIFEKNRKERARENAINSRKKGRDYEKFVTKHFEKLGYKTKEYGLINGRKDKGIDVIIMKNNEVTLIQCKNWKADSSYKIRHKELKEFLGNTTAFLENHKEKVKEEHIIKRLFITSNDVLDNSARHFLKDNSIVEHMIIPINK